MDKAQPHEEESFQKISDILADLIGNSACVT